jgi:hypothetical protein
MRRRPGPARRIAEAEASSGVADCPPIAVVLPRPPASVRQPRRQLALARGPRYAAGSIRHDSLAAAIPHRPHEKGQDMAPIVLSIDIACPPGELFTLGKQAFMFRGLADADADDDDIKLTHDTTMNQSRPKFPVPQSRLP